MRDMRDVYIYIYIYITYSYGVINPILYKLAAAGLLLVLSVNTCVAKCLMLPALPTDQPTPVHNACAKN